MPASGPGSTIEAAKNFMIGLENIVNFIKENHKKERISILGKIEMGLREPLKVKKKVSCLTSF